jgi:hypothetical protein
LAAAAMISKISSPVALLTLTPVPIPVPKPIFNLNCPAHLIMAGLKLLLMPNQVIISAVKAINYSGFTKPQPKKAVLNSDCSSAPIGTGNQFATASMFPAVGPSLFLSYQGRTSPFRTYGKTSCNYDMIERLCYCSLSSQTLGQEFARLDGCLNY